ncbi:MAG: hypothetical protein M1834_009152 [Cirrosporium novae-zelandiae]|nr:MAG: hypothetical protein M1834_009152 [Cirrosporium novae-zelandiae]
MAQYPAPPPYSGAYHYDPQWSAPPAPYPPPMNGESQPHTPLGTAPPIHAFQNMRPANATNFNSNFQGFNYPPVPHPHLPPPPPGSLPFNYSNAPLPPPYPPIPLPHTSYLQFPFPPLQAPSQSQLQTTSDTRPQTAVLEQPIVLTSNKTLGPAMGDKSSKADAEEGELSDNETASTMPSNGARRDQIFGNSLRNEVNGRARFSDQGQRESRPTSRRQDDSPKSNQVSVRNSPPICSPEPIPQRRQYDSYTPRGPASELHRRNANRAMNDTIQSKNNSYQSYRPRSRSPVRHDDGFPTNLINSYRTRSPGFHGTTSSQDATKPNEPRYDKYESTSGKSIAEIRRLTIDALHEFEQQNIKFEDLVKEGVSAEIIKKLLPGFGPKTSSGGLGKKSKQTPQKNVQVQASITTESSKTPTKNVFAGDISKVKDSVTSGEKASRDHLPGLNSTPATSQPSLKTTTLSSGKEATQAAQPPTSANLSRKERIALMFGKLEGKSHPPATQPTRTLQKPQQEHAPLSIPPKPADSPLAAPTPPQMDSEPPSVSELPPVPPTPSIKPELSKIHEKVASLREKLLINRGSQPKPPPISRRTSDDELYLSTPPSEHAKEVPKTTGKQDQTESPKPSLQRGPSQQPPPLTQQAPADDMFSGIPGLFMTSANDAAPTPASPVQPPTPIPVAVESPQVIPIGRKRNVESLQTSGASTPSSKRPFGQSRSFEQVWIGESDDDGNETDNSGNDMDIDDGPEPSPPPQSQTSEGQKPLMIRDMPPLSDFPSRKSFNSPSAVRTPSQIPTPTKTSKPNELALKMEEIERMKKQIAQRERERQLKSKSNVSRPQTPAGTAPVHLKTASHSYSVPPEAAHIDQRTSLSRTRSLPLNDLERKGSVESAEIAEPEHSTDPKNELTVHEPACEQEPIITKVGQEMIENPPQSTNHHGQRASLERANSESTLTAAEQVGTGDSRPRGNAIEQQMSRIEIMRLEIAREEAKLRKMHDEEMKSKKVQDNTKAIVDSPTTAYGYNSLYDGSFVAESKIDSTLRVSNVPYESTKEDIKAFFDFYSVQWLLRPCDPQAQPADFAIVELGNDNDASDAISRLSGQMWNGRNLTVSYAVDGPPKDEPRWHEALIGQGYLLVPPSERRNNSSSMTALEKTPSPQLDSVSDNKAQSQQDEDSLQSQASPIPEIDVIEAHPTIAASVKASSEMSTSSSEEGEVSDTIPINIQHNMAMDQSSQQLEADLLKVAEEKHAPSNSPDSSLDVQGYSDVSPATNASAEICQKEEPSIPHNCSHNHDMTDSDSMEYSDESNDSDEYEPPEPGSPPNQTNGALGSITFSPPPPSEPNPRPNIVDPSVSVPFISDPVQVDSPDEESMLSQIPDAMAPQPVSREQSVIHENKGHFSPYESPLKALKSYRFHPNYLSETQGGYRSVTYSNTLPDNGDVTLCKYETAGGVCNDKSCEYQHFRDMCVSDDKILFGIGRVNEGQTPDQQREYATGLHKIISNLRENRVKDVDTIASEIVAYRRRFLNEDPAKMLPL